MLDYLDLVGTSSVRLHETSTASVMRITGLSGVSGVRGETWDRPEADGVVEPVNQYLPERIITVEGEVWGATIDAAWTSWNTIDAALLRSARTVGTLKWRRSGGTLDVQAGVRLAGDTLVTLDANDQGPFLRYQATFRAADPLIYSQSSQSSTAGAPTSGGGFPFPIVFPIPFGTGISGGSVVVTNNGNASAWPTITITGPIIGPVVANNTQNVAVYFETLTLTTGESLIVSMNPASRSATVAGVSKLGSVRYADSVWWSLDASVANTVGFYGISGGYSGATTMTIAWSDAYVS